MLEGYPVVVEVPVAWGEMDAFQHVNNIVYFRYFESVRMACFRRVGLPELHERTGIGPILASTSCRFKFPLAYPDTVSVATRISSVEETRFGMDYLVVSHAHQRVAAEGEGLIVTYDYREKRKAPVPDEIRDRLLALRG